MNSFHLAVAWRGMPWTRSFVDLDESVGSYLDWSHPLNEVEKTQK